MNKMKTKLLIITLFLSKVVIAQVPTNNGFTLSKIYSEDISLLKAKVFLMNDILNISKEFGQFEFDLIESTSSGELSFYDYRCKDLNKEGLILGFYGDYWNEAGDIFKGFVFKNLPKDKAVELLNKISSTIESQKEYLSNINNASFMYDDISILIYKDLGIKIRIIWKNFDGELENIAFARIKRRFEKDLN